MYLSRKSLLSMMLVAVSFGTPALASAQAPGAHGAVGHQAVIQLATLPRRTRLRRRVRRAKRRLIAWRTGGRVRGATETIRARRESLKPRLAPHDSYPRGPPGFSDR
jgi:hypothetical protein